MKFDKESNGFTYGFAIIMIVIVATLLSAAAISLKPFQKLNIKREKMHDILKTIGVGCSRKESPASFEKYVKQRILFDYQLNKISDDKGVIDENNKKDAFNVDIKKEYRALPLEKRKYPLYICQKEGNKYFVVPMVGTGLWGPIWGYIAFEDDLNTIYGASFDHKTETPGLGAEINKDKFERQFIGEKIFNEKGYFVSISIIKGGALPQDIHGTDAITGGTITSKAVAEMIKRTLSVYVPYFKKYKK